MRKGSQDVCGLVNVALKCCRQRYVEPGAHGAGIRHVMNGRLHRLADGACSQRPPVCPQSLASHHLLPWGEYGIGVAHQWHNAWKAFWLCEGRVRKASFSCRLGWRTERKDPLWASKAPEDQSATASPRKRRTSQEGLQGFQEIGARLAHTLWLLLLELWWQQELMLGAGVAENAPTQTAVVPRPPKRPTLLNDERICMLAALLPALAPGWWRVPYLKFALHMPHAAAWLSGSHLGGSRDSRSPVPSRTALKETRIGGAVGTRVTSGSDVSSSGYSFP